jgi:hypothetical protein
MIILPILRRGAQKAECYRRKQETDSSAERFSGRKIMLPDAFCWIGKETSRIVLELLFV